MLFFAGRFIPGAMGAIGTGTDLAIVGGLARFPQSWLSEMSLAGP
jgi:hypothetical protein